MTVSSHLTPEPERRLWIILENMRHAGEWTDVKLGALTALSAVELALLKPGPVAAALFTLAVPVGIFGLSALKRKRNWLPWLEPVRGKPGYEDAFITVEDVVKYTHGELILKMDKYLGGGITATQYYEDIVGQTLALANMAARKQRVFLILAWLAGLGQLAVLIELLRG